MTPFRKPLGRAARPVRLVAFRAVLATGASLAWLSVGPAQASSTSVAATTQPANLLQGDDATFSTSIGTWSNYNHAALQWAPTSGEGASGGLALTATGSKMVVLSGTNANGGLTPASAGSIYSAAVSAVAPSGAELIQPVLIFYGASGTAINTVFGPGTRLQTTQWAQTAPVVAIAPANTASAAEGIVVYNPTAGSRVVLDNAWIEQTAAARTPAVVGPLSTSGNRIIQANGAQLIPRGVVLNGLETSPTASTVTRQAVIQAKAWGANIVRLPLGEQFWLPSNCDYSPGYQAAVDQVVNWITSLGMVALLDLHTNTILGCQTGGPHNMADEAQSPTFWNQVAARYASNPLVAFDLYNEPHNISDQVWLDGGMTVDSYAPFLPYQAAGMQQLYNTVRASGAHNLVFISGPNWANSPPKQLVVGHNIVYAVHAYTCPDSAPPSCTSLTPYDPSAILNPWVSFSASQAVAVTEFGWPSQSDGTYTANVISYARTQGWGWIAFAWEDSHDPAAWDITARWLANIPAEPAPSGIPVLCEMIRASFGTSPCAAPAIVSPSSPTTRKASSGIVTPSSPTIRKASPATTGLTNPMAKPTAKPTGSAGVIPPSVVSAGTGVPAPGTGDLGRSPTSVRSARAACTAACDRVGIPLRSASVVPANAAKAGPSGPGPMSGPVKVAGGLFAFGIVMLGRVPRRLRTRLSRHRAAQDRPRLT